MDSLFLKKYKIFSSLNNNFQDSELLHPINKSIKATQIYIDTQLTPRKKIPQYRAVSQETRSTPSNIIYPTLRLPRHLSSLPNEIIQNTLGTSQNTSTNPIPSFLDPEAHTQKKNKNKRLFPIKTPRNPFINN